MRTALIDLIIMQITLVPDSVTPAIVLVRHLGWAPFFLIWRKPAIFKFLNFYKRAVIFLNLTLNSAILDGRHFFNMVEARSF